MPRDWTNVGCGAGVLGGLGLLAVLVATRDDPMPEPRSPEPDPPVVEVTPIAREEAPLPPPPSQRDMGCVNRDTEPFGDGIVCWPDGCVRYAPSKLPAIAEWPKRMRWTNPAAVRDRGGVPAACDGKTCKPLGPRLADAIARARADAAKRPTTEPRSKPLLIEISSDRGFVALANAQTVPRYWNVAQDKPIEFQPPEAFKPDPKPRLVTATPLGKRVALLWETCPERDDTASCRESAPPLRTTIADLDGRSLDGVHQAYARIHQIGADRFVLEDDKLLQLVVGDRVVQELTLAPEQTYNAILSETDPDRLAALVPIDDRIDLLRWKLVTISTARDRFDMTEIAQLPDCH